MQLDNGTDDESVPLEEALLPSDFRDDPISSTSTGPEASSTAPPTEGTTPDESGGDEEEALPEFDPRHREEFSGLLYLGALNDEFDWSGHHFKIKTLTQGELLEVGLLSRDYRDTLGDSKAYVTAFVAASLVSVDGRRVTNPLGPGETDAAANFTYIKDAWYPWTIDAIYERCMVLEGRVNEILQAMGKVPPR